MQRTSHLRQTAADVMARNVIRIPNTMVMKEAARVLSAAQVSGAPVVNEAGVCLGVISAVDFVRLAGQEKRPTSDLPATCGFQRQALGADGRVVHCRLPFGVCALQRKSDSPDRPEEVLCIEPHCVPTDWQMVRMEHVPTDAVARYMTPDPVTVSENAPLRQVARTMLDAHIHRVIVVDAGGRPVGLVASTDIVAALACAARPALAGTH